jgi:hypothetical protein
VLSPRPLGIADDDPQSTSKWGHRAPVNPLPPPGVRLMIQSVAQFVERPMRYGLTKASV